MQRRRSIASIAGLVAFVLIEAFLLGCPSSDARTGSHHSRSTDLEQASEPDPGAEGTENTDSADEVPVDSETEEVEESAPTSDVPVVCLDPGHPSEVNDGMTVQNGLTETHVNWLVACELRDILEADEITVVMTKSSEDEAMTNEERARIANEAGADLFFRIHCDTGSASSTGMTFYFPDQQGTWDGHTGPPEEILPACREAVYAIHDSVVEELDGLLSDRGVLPESETYIGAQQGGALRGSILSEVPVVLVELCFLSNPDDADLMRNSVTRSRVVEALASGIEEYLSGLFSDN